MSPLPSYEPEHHLLVWLRLQDDAPVCEEAPPAGSGGWTERIDRLRVQLLPQPGYGLVRLEGVLDGRGLESTSKALDRARREAGPSLVVDLALSQPGTVEWVSALNEARRPIEEAGGRLVLVAPPPAARDHLALLGLEDLFGIAHSVDEAASLLVR